MNENQSSEYGTGRGVERLPNGRPRPLTDRERVRIERTAGLRDAALGEVEREFRDS
jgi:hypothetical protein